MATDQDETPKVGTEAEARPWKTRRYYSISIAIAFILWLVAGAASAGLRIASWNIRHLGWDNGLTYPAVARVLSRFDLIAVQEVMAPAAARRLAQTVQAITDQPWGVLTSDPVGRTSYQEGYAFIWRKAEVALAEGAVLYLDPGDVFARQPLSAVFRNTDTGRTLVLATVHIIYGDGVKDRVAEIKALDDYWNWLAASYPDTPRLLVGDFNLEYTHPAWNPLDRLADPIILHHATTLSPDNGEYASAYDNIWIGANIGNITAHGVALFPRWLGVTHEWARDHVSDHAPVYLVLGHGAHVSTAPFAGADQAAPALRHKRRDCIDLNKAPASVLDRITHIGPARATAIVEGRLWESIGNLVEIDGIGAGRLADIRAQGLLCGLLTRVRRRRADRIPRSLRLVVGL